jgi:hypothetical protein
LKNLTGAVIDPLAIGLMISKYVDVVSDVFERVVS